jgi:predicted nuclease with TOPRIM domain
MQEQLQERLEALKKEFATGQARLQELDIQQGHLRETLLRISGAIQVLEELLEQGQPAQENPNGRNGPEPS